MLIRTWQRADGHGHGMSLGGGMDGRIIARIKLLESKASDMTRCETNLHVIASGKGAMSLCERVQVKYLPYKSLLLGVNYMASVARSLSLPKIITSQLQGEFGVCEAVATASLEFILGLGFIWGYFRYLHHYPAISGVPGLSQT